MDDLLKRAKQHLNVWQSQQILCKVYKRCTRGEQSLLREGQNILRFQGRDKGCDRKKIAPTWSSSEFSSSEQSWLSTCSERWGTLSGSVWTKYSLLVFLVFMSSRIFLLWIVSNYELSKTKTKKTTLRLANILCCGFTRPRLRLGSLFYASQTWRRMRMKRRKMRRRSPSCRSSQLAPQLPFDLQPTLNKRPSLPCTDYLWQVIFHRCSNFHDSIRSHLPSDERRARVQAPSVWTHGIFFLEKKYFKTWSMQIFGSCQSPLQGVFLKNF